MDDLNEMLEAAFFFSPADLRFNRIGKLSPRQQARQRAAGTNLWLAAGVFILVMLGSLGMILFINQPSSATTGVFESNPTLVIIAAVVVIVIVAGVLISIRYMPIAREKQVSEAKGVARWGKQEPERSNFELRLGSSKLRLLTAEQLAAFQEGQEYQVYYLKGPVPTILSAEAPREASDYHDTAGEIQEVLIEQDQVVQMQRNARPILFVLALLALGIPLIGFATAGFPPVLRWPVMVILLFVSIGFVYWAVKRAGASFNG